MSFQQRPNSGALFKNKQKQPGDRLPDYRGNCEVNGVKMEISAWIKDGQKGKFMSLAFKPASERPAPDGEPREGREVPF